MAQPSRRQRNLVLLITLALGAWIFLWQLGSTGLIDETPSLFAASARAMAETGDWLIPHVNGLPRYDKPPLVYWLMGLVYALPGQSQWNPLGTWAAAMPSALASIGVMLALADTLLRWPQPRLGKGPGRIGPSGLNAESAGTDGIVSPPPGPAPSPGTAGSLGQLLTPLTAALAFALGPLVLLWGRVPVSDALFSALLAAALLLCWRRYVEPGQPWWAPWGLLGLAVLTKGPVALLLLGLTLLLFGWLQRDLAGLVRRLRPLPGLLLSLLVALPWYALALLREGRPFWDSFFGYHNLQRFTSVVNHHLQPWWFFVPVLLIASLPATPLLLLALVRALGPLELARRPARPHPNRDSLARFAACWLLVVFAFFTLAATKLPSYWLPATPAAALLVALVVQAKPADINGKTAAADRWAWGLTLLLTLLLAMAFLAAPLWVPLIQDPEMPTLPAELLASGRLLLAGALWGLAALLGWILALRRRSDLQLLGLQLPLLLFVPAVLLPCWALGDRVRGLPVRQIAAAADEAIAASGRGATGQGQANGVVGSQARSAGALTGPQKTWPKDLSILESVSPARIDPDTAGAEPLAMVGILKPSLHYYSRRLVIYEGIEPEGLVNLAERLRLERRPGQVPSGPGAQPYVLVVIDRTTAASSFWQGLEPEELHRAGPYHLWRLNRRQLEQRAAELVAAGHRPTWELPRPERY